MYAVVENDETMTIVQVTCIEDARRFAQAIEDEGVAVREATEIDLINFQNIGGVVRNLLGS